MTRNENAKRTGTVFSAAIMMALCAGLLLLAGCKDLFHPEGSDDDYYLSPPSSVGAVANSSNGITVSWISVSGATSYRLYRSTSSSGTYSYLTSTSSTSYTDTGLPTNATYYYKVSAYNSSYGETSMSSVYGYATTSASSLSPPSSVSAVANSSSRITVSWSSVSGATSYYLYRSTSYSGTYSYLTSTSSTSYTDTGLPANATYYYKVSAYNSSYGETSMSNYGYATTSASYTDINDEIWHTYTLSAGTSHYYRIYVPAGSTCNIVWEDYDCNSSLADIRVSASWQSGGEEIFSATDGYVTESDSWRIRSFYASSSGYVILKVEGYSSTSSGSYGIGYYYD
jgi:hypothetical protein